MRKNTVILAITSVIVVIMASAAAGILLAIKTSIPVSDESNKAKPKSEIIKKETANSSSTLNSNSNEWKQENGSWYFIINGEKQKNWILSNNRWYFLGSDGKMKTEWVKDKNKWYYFGNDGKMRTGWLKFNSNWYYLNDDGGMEVNTNVSGLYINEKGILQGKS
jgi:glucan-binding YG repeat protein